MMQRHCLHLSFQGQSRAEKSRGWVQPNMGIHRSRSTAKTDNVDIVHLVLTSVCPFLACTHLTLDGARVT